MKSKLLTRDKIYLSEAVFAEILIWRVPVHVRGSLHEFKYSLAFVENNVCVFRYDNEAGKGDHKHIGDTETPYRFTDLDRLQDDFWADVDEWRAAP